jgi:hypothetical protein
MDRMSAECGCGDHGVGGVVRGGPPGSVASVNQRRPI